MFTSHLSSCSHSEASEHTSRDGGEGEAVILLIESDPSEADLFRRAAAEIISGVELIWKRTLDEGLEVFDECDVMVIDLDIPEMSPTDVLEVLASRSRKARMVFTGHRTPELARRCGQLGLSYTPKTVELEDLILLLENAIGLFQYSQRLSQALDDV